MKWADLIKLIVPAVIATANPKLGPLAGVIIAGINEAQNMTKAKGAQKLAHVENLAVMAAQGVNAGAQRVLVDPVLVQQTAGSIISAAVDAANLIARTPPAPGVGTEAAKEEGE